MEKNSKLNQKHLLRRSLYVCSGALLLLNGGAGIASVVVMNQNRVQASEVAPRAGLADISILTNASLTSMTGTDMTPNAQGNYDLALKYSGTGLASVGVADKKVLVYALPAELQGKVVGGATVDIDANLLPITPGDIPGVSLLFGALGTAIDGLNAVVKIPAVKAAFDSLSTVQNLGAYQETLPATVSPDGKTISVDFTQGFGKYVHQAYVALFDTLRDAIAAIDADGILVKPLVEALQAASAKLFDIIDAIADGTSDILDNALNANLLGSMNGTLHTTVSDPGVASATVKAGAINNAMISADVLTAIEQEGEAVTLNFPTTAVNPFENYDVAAPVITQPVAGQTQVAGQVTLTRPIPDGTTFEAVVTLPDGSTKNVSLAADGTFVVDTGSLVDGQTISAKVVATNGTYTKDSPITTATVTAAPIENPIANYDVATPTVDPLTAGDPEITGQVTLNQPIPLGTTFEAVATLPDGSQLTGTVESDGTFKIAGVDQLAAGQTVTVKVIATNGSYTKDSAGVQLNVEAAPVEDPLANYQMATPTIDQARDGDTNITGQVTLSQPIPAGTTFEAIAVLPGGRQVTGAVNADGSFTVATGDPLVAGTQVAVHIKAVNGIFSKESTPATMTVADALPTNPIENYDVPAPLVTPATEGDKSVKGHVNLVTPIPANTTFKALVTYEDGTTAEAAVPETGDFEVPTRTLVADEKVSVKVIVQNGMNQKESPMTEITISKAVATDPLDGYTVPKPSVDPVTSTDTSVTGQITFNNPPVGTTFIANVKMADGSIKKANVMPDGTFTVATGALEANAVLEVTITAQNSGYEKVSAPTTITVSKADPLENYVVAKPSVDPIKEGDQAVTGNVTLNKPVPDGTTFEAVVTLPNGDQITATVDDQGHFTVPVAGIKEGDKLTIEVVAHNDGFDKNSDLENVTVNKTVPTNPLEGYGVAQPVVDSVKAGDTAVTGKVTLEEPIPAGTTFEAEVTLPDGSTKTGKLNPDGTFTVDTGTLVAEDELIVHVIAHNGANQKESNSVHVIVAADTTTNPIENYTVNAPVVNPMTDGETQVTGQVNLGIPIPNGTTFTAVVTLADGTTTSAPVAADGQFTVATNTLVAETTVGVKIVATNGTFIKDSSIVYQTVSPQLDTNPLANYTVNQPTVEPVTANQTSVKGQVTLATPIPDGTTFEATVTLPSGTQKTAAVDANGNFEVVTGRLTADSDLSVKITAKNSTYTKDSENVSVTVGAATAENPLENYVVAEPVVDPVKAGDKNVTGSVEFTKPVPDGTSFEAVMTLPNGDKVTADIDDQGHFTIPVDGIKEGDELTVEVIAHNGDNEKLSDPVTVPVDKAVVTNPLEDYVVAKPTVDPVKAGDKAVTGSVIFAKPIPEGTNFTAVVTLPNGVQVRVPVDENGQFAARVDGLKAGDRIIVQILAENDGHQKASVPVDILVSASDFGNPGDNDNGSGDNGTGDGTGTGNNGSGLGNDQLGGSGNGQLGGHGPSTLKPLTISSKNLHQTNSRQGTNGQHLPQTGEKVTSVWSWLGMLLLTAALFIKRLVPIKRDK